MVRCCHSILQLSTCKAYHNSDNTPVDVLWIPSKTTARNSILLLCSNCISVYSFSAFSICKACHECISPFLLFTISPDRKKNISASFIVTIQDRCSRRGNHKRNCTHGHEIFLKEETMAFERILQFYKAKIIEPSKLHRSIGLSCN